MSNSLLHFAKTLLYFLRASKFWKLTNKHSGTIYAVSTKNYQKLLRKIYWVIQMNFLDFSRELLNFVWKTSIIHVKTNLMWYRHDSVNSLENRDYHWCKYVQLCIYFVFNFLYNIAVHSSWYQSAWVLIFEVLVK